MIHSCLKPCEQLPYTERKYEHAGKVPGPEHQKRVSRPEKKKDYKIFYALVFILFLLYLRKQYY